jgi:hypothetical protein
MSIAIPLRLENYPSFVDGAKLILLGFGVDGSMVIAHLEGKPVARPSEFDQDKFLVRYYFPAIKAYKVHLSAALTKLSTVIRR